MFSLHYQIEEKGHVPISQSTPLALEFSAQCTLQKDQDLKDLPITLRVIV